jgi:hypothetical protein
MRILIVLIMLLLSANASANMASCEGAARVYKLIAVYRDLGDSEYVIYNEFRKNNLTFLTAGQINAATRIVYGHLALFTPEQVYEGILTKCLEPVGK